MLENVSSRKGLSLIVIIAVSIALAIYFVQGITSNTSATNKAILNLASDTNLDVDAVFTSDGNTALLPTTSHLYIIDIASGNNIKLLNLASDTMPGVDVVFTADDMIAVLPTTSHLYMIEIPSGGIKELINLASDTNTDVDVVITPDGNTALLPTTSHLYIIDIPSGNIKALINLASNTQKCVDVMITPDGNTALLPTTSHLYIIDIPSGNVRELLNLASDTNLEVDVRITPDGNTALLPTTSHLYIIDVSSGNIQTLLNLASNTMPGVDIVVTPEGNTAFLPTILHLHVIDVSSGNIKTLLNLASDTMPGVDIVVTPEGNTALLPTTSHLYMIDVSSGNIKMLLNLASDTMKGVDIVVTPEGNTAFLPTTSHLYMIDVSSGNIKTLLNLASDTNLDIDLEVVCPIISGLSGSIAILPTRSHLYIIDDLPQDNVLLPTSSHLYMLNVQSCNIKELLNLASNTMQGVDVVIARNILTADPDEDFPVLPASTQTLPPHPHREKLIFSIEAGELEKDLDEGTVPERLKEKFEAEKIPLSEDVIVEKSGDGEWTITDKKKYIARKKEGMIDVYLKERDEPVTLILKVRVDAAKESPVAVIKLSGPKGHCFMLFMGDKAASEENRFVINGLKLDLCTISELIADGCVLDEKGEAEIKVSLVGFESGKKIWFQAISASGYPYEKDLQKSNCEMISVLVIPHTSNYQMLQYDAQRTGSVSGIAPETATILWQSGEKTSGCIQAGPIVSDGRVYISTWWSSGMGVKGNGVDALYCLNVSTGEEIWNNTDVYGASTAAIADGKLFVGTQKGNITCIDAASGELEWSKKIEENPSWYGVTSSPLVVDDKVYVLSFSDGTLHAFSFDGEELWNFSTGGEIFCYSSPSACGDKLFFAGNNEGQHALYCLDLNNREEVWKFTTETEIRGSPTIWSEEEMVFFTTEYLYGEPHKLYAVDITTGEEVWNVPHNSTWASPALSHGKLYIGGSAVDTTFYCYDALNGSLIWKNEEMGGAIDSSPVVADGKVYFGTNEVDGTVYALDAENGSKLWNYTLHIPEGFGGGFNIASPPAISDRTLFIGVDNVGVLAFRDSTFWEDKVTLTANTTVNVTAHNSGESYEINQTTSLGALDAAAEAGGFNYTISDDWYASWGSFILTSIAGIENEPWPGDTWYVYINNEAAPFGLSLNTVENGNTVSFFYGEFCVPDNSSMVMRIHIHVVEATPFVSLDPVASVAVVEPLVVTGTSNWQE